jgi:hypothetical protein
MKREAVLLVFGVFLMVFIIGGVSASSLVSISNSDNNGYWGGGGWFGFNKDISLNYQYDNGLYINQYPGNIKFTLFDITPSFCSYSNDVYQGGLRGFYTDVELNTKKQNYSGFFIGNYGLRYWDSIQPSNLGFKVDGTIILKGKDGEILNLPSEIEVRFDNFTCDETHRYTKGNINVFIIQGFSTEEQKNNSSDYENRISTLESWKQTITDTITSILNRITKVENKTIGNSTIVNNITNNITTTIVSNSTIPNYFKYLSSSERKAMVCGYGQDNHLVTISDLGWNCTITYKTNQYTKKETASCKCSGK